MSFAWPHLLWLLLVPAALLGWELTRQRHAQARSNHPKILRAQIGTEGLALARDQRTATGRRIRPWFFLGLAFAIVALARPQWGRLEEPVFDQSREILLAVDLSRSMLSPDVKPSRLERSKLLIQALLEKLQGERVGLIVFSGTAFLQSPLSSDYEILREFLPALSPDFLPEGGTNYEALINTALDAFASGTAADRFLIILSDGEATDDAWRARADELKKKGIRVIGLGVGTIAGTMIPDGSGGFVKDSRGAVVLSKLESGTLQELAEKTDGVYQDASTWIDLAGLIDRTVNAAQKGKFEDRATIRLVERFQWPLALAVWCLVVSFYYELPVRPRTRQIALRGAGPTTDAKKEQAKAAAVATLLVAGILTLLPGRAAAAVKIASPNEAKTAAAPDAPANAITAPSTLGRVVGRLSQKDKLSAPDLSEFAHETLHWGHALKDGGQPVPEGPVRDALAAVDQLEASGGKMADWAELRKQLEALLEKPEEKQNQKQQQQQQQQKNQSDSQQNKQDQKQNRPEQKDQNQQNQKQQGSPPKPDQQKDEKNEPQKGEPSQGQQPPPPQDQKSEASAFGDMKKPPAQPPPPPQPAENTQKVGGAREEKTPPEKMDPALAVPLGKLDQLKNQDSPAELFQLMQPEPSSQKKNAKDW